MSLCVPTGLWDMQVFKTQLKEAAPVPGPFVIHERRHTVHVSIHINAWYEHSAAHARTNANLNLNSFTLQHFVSTPSAQTFSPLTPSSFQADLFSLHHFIYLAKHVLPVQISLSHICSLSLDQAHTHKHTRQLAWTQTSCIVDIWLLCCSAVSLPVRSSGQQSA